MGTIMKLVHKLPIRNINAWEGTEGHVNGSFRWLKFAVWFKWFSVPDRSAVALIKSQLSLNMVSLCHFNVMTCTSMALSSRLWVMSCKVRRWNKHCVKLLERLRIHENSDLVDQPSLSGEDLSGFCGQYHPAVNTSPRCHCDFSGGSVHSF